MKKFLSILLICVLVLGCISGCSNTNSDNGKLKVAIVQPMEHTSLNEIRDSIIAELNALGLSDQIEIITQNASGDMSLLPTIMQGLVNDNVNVIVPIATNTAQAAAAATTKIPIVFSAVSNPVEAGLVTALDQTTQNITGVSDSVNVNEILSLAQTLVPNLKTIGFVYNSSEINSITAIERAKKYCENNGLAYKEATVTATSDVHQAVSSLVGNVDAFFTPDDNTIASSMATYTQIANENKLPIFTGADSMVKDGGFATVGINYTNLGKQTAQMVKRILIDGQSISENPVEQLSEYSKIINTSTAKKIDISLSDDILKDFMVISE